MQINILLIEDNPGDARLVFEMIKEINYEVNDNEIKFFHKKSLENNLKEFLILEKISLVLLDLGLPGTQGEETVKKFKKIDPEIILIAYTGMNDIRLGTKLLDLGADDYICKNETTTSILYKTIFLNIKRKELSKELEEKSTLLINQSRSAAMGDMIAMITHQWKQPLSTLAMISNNIKVDCELKEIDIENFIDYSNDLSIQVNHLSTTVDDFIDFFKAQRNQVMYSISKVIEKTLQLMNASLKNNHIEVIKYIDEVDDIMMYPNELSHVILNLIKNSKDALVDNGIKEKKIIIRLYQKDNIFIEIEDNATGINEEIKEKVFNSYFTTKEESNGTGIGLYMSKTIIEEHFLGNIDFENTKDGVNFTVSIPTF